MEKFENALKLLKSLDEIDEKEAEKFARMLVSKIEEKFEQREIAEAIWTVLVFGVRENWDQIVFEQKLGDGNNMNTMKKLYEKYKSELAIQMKTIRWEYPEVVNFDWNVAKTEKTSVLGPSSLSQPQTTITLETLAAGSSKTEKMNISFDQVQLTDFLWKLKEADNFVKNLK